GAVLCPDTGLSYDVSQPKNLSSAARPPCTSRWAEANTAFLLTWQFGVDGVTLRAPDRPETTMTLTQKAAWRSPALGQPRELKLQDCTLRCWEAGRGEPLVLVHGVLLNANVWRKVVPRLAPDFRCIALDLPMGSHAQPMPSADRSAAGLARMVVGALDALGL